MPAKLRDPIFVFDSKERFHPLAVESVEAVPATINGAEVSLADLPAAGGRMNFPPNPERIEKELQDEFGAVGYRREVDGGGLTWVQHWLWYLHNPKIIVVTGDHEGDWEFVQVGYADDKPICMTASQHKAGGSRMWWDIERRDGRPVIHVAVDSHANYFAPPRWLPWVQDTGDGKGAVLDAIEWREFGDWATWPGRWGNSDGDGQSPESPGCQGDRWSAPHRYHAKATNQPG